MRLVTIAARAGGPQRGEISGPLGLKILAGLSATGKHLDVALPPF